MKPNTPSLHHSTTPSVVAFLFALLAFFAVNLPANAQYFGQATDVRSATTNTGILLTNVATVNVPGFTVTFSNVTNALTICSNQLMNSLFPSGTNPISSSNYVFSAATSGTGTVTVTFPPQTFTVTNFTYLQTSPQNVASNLYSIK